MDRRVNFTKGKSKKNSLEIQKQAYRCDATHGGITFLMKKWTFKIFGWALKLAPSLLGAKLVLVLVLVPITHLACVYLCVCMCGYLAADSTGDLPHGTTRSSWYHGEIPKICPRICMSTADPDFYVDDKPMAHNTFVLGLLWAILPFFGRSIYKRTRSCERLIRQPFQRDEVDLST